MQRIREDIGVKSFLHKHSLPTKMTWSAEFEEQLSMMAKIASLQYRCAIKFLNGYVKEEVLRLEFIQLMRPFTSKQMVTKQGTILMHVNDLESRVRTCGRIEQTMWVFT